MLVTTNVPGHAGRAPSRPSGCCLLASIDVEWTKNYRIKNGNVPFCYSVIYLAVPDGEALCGEELAFSYTSVYVEDPGETAALVASANDAVRTAFAHADRVTGHQFTSDLAVLARAGHDPLPDVAVARRRWLARRDTEVSQRAIIDTRYDAGHLLAQPSRRLVDVCTELGLDVTQPELRGTSMTALHRSYLDTGNPLARERISVLNLRHSLSTALVALRVAGHGHWPATLNVNRILAHGLAGDTFTWLRDPAFLDLLRGQP